MSPNPEPEPVFPVLHLLLGREDASPSNVTNSALGNSTNPQLSPNSTLSAPANGTTPTPVLEHHGGLSGWLIAIIIILTIGAVSSAAFTIYKLAFQRHTPASAGFGRGPFDSIKAWFAATTYKLRNPRNRQADAGFEGISAGAAGMGASGSRYVDGGDEAWDSRVHDDEEYGVIGARGAPQEGYEMGPTRFSSEYKGAAPGGYSVAGGRYRDENVREYNEQEHGRGRGPIPAANPFGDENATNESAGAGGSDRMRSVSPRPMLALDTQHLEPGQGSSRQTSPTRRSVFHEEMSAS